MQRSIILIIPAFLLLTFTKSTVADVDAIDNYCRLWNHQSTYKVGRIYIDGGEMVYTDKNNGGVSTGAEYYGNMNQLLSLDVSRSWNWTDAGFSQNMYTRYSKGNSTDMTTSIPSRQRGALFGAGAGSSDIYLYGGTTPSLNKSFSAYRPPQDQGSSLWSFNNASQSWTEYNSQNVFGLSTKVPNAGAWESAPLLGLAFYYGGQVDNGSSTEDQSLDTYSYSIPGLIVLDTKTQTARNVSTQSSSADTAKTRSKMTYIQNVGSQGILLRLGGLSQSLLNDNDSITGSLMSFDKVQILDVSTVLPDKQPTTATWYQQSATGEVPAPRTDFCIVSVSAADNSSHHVYMYGGRNGNNFFDDVYVLSLPLFRWSLLFQGQRPRAFHTCHVVAGSQMITIAGITSFDLLNGCDWEDVGVGILDLNTALWTQYYNSTQVSYQVPKQVTDVIGGGPFGGANVTAPAGGFEDSKLRQVFNPSSASSGLSAGKIVAIVLCALVILLAALTILFRKTLIGFVYHPSRSRGPLTKDDETQADTHSQPPVTEGYQASNRPVSMNSDAWTEDPRLHHGGHGGDDDDDHEAIDTTDMNGSADVVSIPLSNRV